MDVDLPMATEPESNEEAAQASNSGETTSAPEAPPPQPTAQSILSGPRPTPNYSVVIAIIVNKEDGPDCRCSHTLTTVPPIGKEGTPGYIVPRLHHLLEVLGSEPGRRIERSD